MSGVSDDDMVRALTPRERVTIQRGVEGPVVEIGRERGAQLIAKVWESAKWIRFICKPCEGPSEVVIGIDDFNRAGLALFEECTPDRFEPAVTLAGPIVIVTEREQPAREEA